VSFHLEVTCFGLGPHHQKAKKYTITKRQVQNAIKQASYFTLNSSFMMELFNDKTVTLHIVNGS
jgi:hypothetical protein